MPYPNREAQWPGHVIPRGVLRTDPRPRTFTASETTDGTNVAVTDKAAFMVSAQSAEPEQAPSQRRNCEPGAAVADRWTRTPCSHAIAQAPGQAIPGRSLVTVPRPRPVTPTESGSCGAPTWESQGESWTSNQPPGWP